MNLPPKQLQALILLASGKTGRDVARELKITPQTVSEWKRGPSFVVELNRLQREVVEAARIRLQQSATEAADILLGLARDATNDETRRKAAVDLLRLGGFEPASPEAFALGIGPATEEGVMDQWEEEACLRNWRRQKLGLL